MTQQPKSKEAAAKEAYPDVDWKDNKALHLDENLVSAYMRDGFIKGWEAYSEQQRGCGRWVSCAERLPVGTKPAVNIQIGQVGMLSVFKDAALFKIEYPATELVYKFDDPNLYNHFIFWDDSSPCECQSDSDEIEIALPLSLINKAFDSLDDNDTEGHIWWGRMKDLAIKHAALTCECQQLREAAEELLHLHSCEQEGLQSGKPTPEMWFNAVNKLSEALSDAGNKEETKK